MENRTNVELSAAIVEGLHIDSVKGSAAAWVYMRNRSVPMDIILRLLALPAMRRPTDPGHTGS